MKPADALSDALFIVLLTTHQSSTCNDRAGAGGLLSEKRTRYNWNEHELHVPAGSYIIR